MDATLKLFLENKMSQVQTVEIFNVLKTTNVRAAHASNAQTKKTLVTLLVIYLKIINMCHILFLCY